MLREGVEHGGGSQAWLSLARLEQRAGRADAALAALEQAEATQSERDERIAFLKGDLLVELGRIDAAEALLDDFEEESYRELLRGRILLVRGEPAQALAAFESGLRRWPNNAGARFLAALAARAIGDEARAVAELRESVRVDAGATDAALVLATLALARGAPQEALDAARLFVERRGRQRPEGYRVAIRALRALGRDDAARRTTEELRDAGFPLEAALERAELEAAAAGGGEAGARAALEALRASGLDPRAPGHEPLLRARAERLLEAGRGSEALAAVQDALSHDPERASLHALHGAVLVRLGRAEDARAAFERALALDPDEGHARAGLAALAHQSGDLARALALYDEAARALPDDPAPAYAAARIELDRGRAEAARARLDALVRRHPGHAGARNDLAWLLASRGEELDRALALAEGARQLAPSPEVLDTLGFVHLQRGDAERAAALFEEALAASPDAPTIRFHLGLALARRGEHERAAEAFRRALAAGPFPEADAARAELARLAAPAPEAAP